MNRGVAFEKMFRAITYVAAHARCRRMWGPASQYDCVDCGGQAKEWAYDGTDPTQIYGPNKSGGWTTFSRFPEFYMPMCWRCHRVKDKNMAAKELQEYREWKHRTGLTLEGLDVWLVDTRTLTSTGSVS